MAVPEEGVKSPCEHGHGRGFARSVVAQKRRDLAFVEVERQIVDSHLPVAEIIKLIVNIKGKIT